MLQERIIAAIITLLLVLSMGGCSPGGAIVPSEDHLHSEPSVSTGAATIGSTSGTEATEEQTTPQETIPGGEVLVPSSPASSDPTEASQPSDPTEAPTEPSAPPVESTPPQNPSEPTEPSPPTTEPPVTEPTATEPTATQPTETEPIETEPKETKHVHSYTEEFIPSVCGKWAAYRYTCSCGHSYTVNDTSIPPNDHTYSYTRTPTADFWLEHLVATCTLCGDSYEADVQASEIDPAIIDQIEARTIYWVNQLRLGEGTPACEAPPVFQEVAHYRAQQLLDNFEHDTADLREACAAYQYGKFMDATLYGDDASMSYYTFGGAEAIAKGFKGDEIEDTAKYFAQLIFDSKSHWSYVGDAKYLYIAVGIAYEPNNLVGAIFVSTENYG